MAVKNELIKLFEQNRGRYLSGEEIAESLGCTRGAVWKAVKKLQSEGYDISAVTNRGYRLDSADMLSAAGVEKYLGDNSGISLTVYKETDSTNTRLRELAANGAPEGTAVIAGMQTGGKGRLGRKFFSPSNTGLYLSILLKPEMTAADAVRITTAAAVAVAEAVEKISGKRSDIKWVNDVYMDGRKICGILTEASFNLENGGLDYAVCGIGINVYEPEGGFPEDIKDIAGAVLDTPAEDIRNRMAAMVLENFMGYYRHLSENSFLQGYQSRLMWRGEDINIIRGSEITPAKLIDADEKCRLMVRYEDGTEDTVSSGEISIRKRK
ncbi:biotin--[acetyl-CoA-carboxylase] ligase [Ruminococcus albus]|uniref:Bifunctional ligase/repressor BirA n=1 Tax=Ruminococcus albus TaxID=1264 RepID=A0A1H7H3M6_RUMAL|nr:biotin--[acetyl-CoA-carboxylase] ligase [Ruminococcus albus]SEK45036.1 BirA family transcriptional regulator, biotin operon repressor / biotin-[acetyl-CoA-carboxylase] ligase [Ruminococcus albus]